MILHSYKVNYFYITGTVFVELSMDRKNNNNKYELYNNTNNDNNCGSFNNKNHDKNLGSNNNNNFDNPLPDHCFEEACPLCPARTISGSIILLLIFWFQMILM